MVIEAMIVVAYPWITSLQSSPPPASSRASSDCEGHREAGGGRSGHGAEEAATIGQRADCREGYAQGRLPIWIKLPESPGVMGDPNLARRGKQLVSASEEVRRE